MTVEQVSQLRGFLATISLELGNLKYHYQKNSDKLDSPTRSEMVDNFNRLDKILKRATASLDLAIAALAQSGKGVASE